MLMQRGCLSWFDMYKTSIDFNQPDDQAHHHTQAALVKKILAWATHQKYWLGLDAVARPPMPLQWRHVTQLNDCYNFAHDLQVESPAHFYRPINITFKTKSRLVVRAARYTLVHLYALKARKNHINAFARINIGRHKPSLQLMLANFQRARWLNILRLACNSTSTLVLKSNYQATATYFMLPISKWIYADIIKYLEVCEEDVQCARDQMSVDFTYYDNIVFKGHKKRNLKLLKGIWNHFDVPKHIEIDYTALTARMLNNRMHAFGYWYGTTRYLYWNFFNLYNWKFFY